MRSYTHRLKLTKSAIDGIEPTSRTEFYRDSELSGFALRVTARGAKAFIVEKRIGRRIRRITLGRYGHLTPDQARKKAIAHLGNIAMGVDPAEQLKTEALARTTLEEALTAFLAARKGLKPRTVHDYKRHLRVSFGSWATKPLIAITGDMVARRHSELGARSPAQANQAMRFLRSLFNFAAASYLQSDGASLIIENPVARISKTRSWYRVRRRRTVISAHDLPRWYAAVLNHSHTAYPSHAATVRDYLLFLLFTGMRRTEAAQLRWVDVDLNAMSVTLRDTKNCEDHVLPLSDYLAAMLRRRRLASSGATYVFEGRSGRGIDAPTKHMRAITAASGVRFCLHDLRRTFATIAESLDLSTYALKRLLNHKDPSDVTAGYIVSDVDKLRTAMQLVTDAILARCETRSADALRKVA